MKILKLIGWIFIGYILWCFVILFLINFSIFKGDGSGGWLPGPNNLGGFVGLIITIAIIKGLVALKLKLKKIE